MGNTLGAKGTLISEPDFLSRSEMRFFPREKGKMASAEGFSLERLFSLSHVGKNRISQGIENRGSLINVPVALRAIIRHLPLATKLFPKSIPKEPDSVTVMRLCNCDETL